MKPSSVLVVVAAGVSLAGCGSRPAPRPAPKKELAAIRIVPPTIGLGRAGETRVLVAEGLDADGEPFPLGGLTWASSQHDVVTVDGSGRITASSSGTAEITATREGVEGAATVTVAIPGAIRVEPPIATITGAGDRARFTATVLDDRGTPIAGRPVAFAVAEPLVASVDEAGAVTGVGDGETLVTVTSGDLGSEVKVVVSGLGAPRAGSLPVTNATGRAGKRTTSRRGPRG